VDRQLAASVPQPLLCLLEGGEPDQVAEDQLAVIEFDLLAARGLLVEYRGEEGSGREVELAVKSQAPVGKADAGIDVDEQATGGWGRDCKWLSVSRREEVALVVDHGLRKRFTYPR
jgi:hypothetical protein